MNAKVFSPLKSLRRAVFIGNACINAEWDDSESKIVGVFSTLRSSCAFKEDVGQITNTSENPTTTRDQMLHEKLIEKDLLIEELQSKLRNATMELAVLQQESKLHDSCQRDARNSRVIERRNQAATKKNREGFWTATSRVSKIIESYHCNFPVRGPKSD